MHSIRTKITAVATGTIIITMISALPSDRTKIRIGETVSAGMVEYDSDRHYSLMSVFVEADKAMYERKQYMKEYCREDGSRP